jgi:hypothetical protein
VIKDGKPLSELEHLNQAARQMLDQLAWWTAALKAAREKGLRQAAYRRVTTEWEESVCPEDGTEHYQGEWIGLPRADHPDF